jgi:hypothetical protein
VHLCFSSTVHAASRRWGASPHTSRLHAKCWCWLAAECQCHSVMWQCLLSVACHQVHSFMLYQRSNSAGSGVCPEGAAGLLWPLNVLWTIGCHNSHCGRLARDLGTCSILGGQAVRACGVTVPFADSVKAVEALYRKVRHICTALCQCGACVCQ